MQLPIFRYATIPCPAALLLPCDSGISSLPERHSPMGDAASEAGNILRRRHFLRPTKVGSLRAGSENNL